MKKLVCFVALCVMLFGVSAIFARKSRKRDSAKLLYAKRCTAGCHRLYKPEEYSGKQWVKIMDVMGPRAKLGIEENIEIRSYLASLEEAPFEPLYRVWKEEGAEAAVALHSDQLTLLVFGDKLLEQGHAEAAAALFEAFLSEYPDSKYGYYTNYRVAAAHNSIGNDELAAKYCGRAVELNPEFEPDPSICGE